jgi:hypothetical protein
MPTMRAASMPSRSMMKNGTSIAALGTALECRNNIRLWLCEISGNVNSVVFLWNLYKLAVWNRSNDLSTLIFL